MTRGGASRIARAGWRLLLAALAAGPATAQEQATREDQGIQRPAAAGRLVAAFDFEEHESNPGEVPRHWYRARDTHMGIPRERFPEWNGARLSYRSEGGISRHGEGSVELPTRGGSTSMMLSPGVVPVFEDADYVVSGDVMTRGLTGAAAFMVARLLDQSGKPVSGGEFRSPPMRSENEWSNLSVRVPGGVSGAAYMQIELLVLQAQDYSQAALGPHQIWPEDLAGSAYFDNIEVSQPPRVELSTSSPSNILLARDIPMIYMKVRDLTGEDLMAELRLFGSDGSLLDRHSLPVSSGLVDAAWHPKVSGYGWYRCVMDVMSGTQRVGGSYVDFVWIMRTPMERLNSQTEEDPVRTAIETDLTAFGLALHDGSDDAASLLPDAIARLGARHAALPILHPGLTQQSVGHHARTLTRAIDRLTAESCHVTMVLGPVPETVAAALHISAQDSWSFVQSDPGVWMPYVAAMLDRYGERLGSWQVGRFTDAFGIDASPSLVTGALKLRKELSALVSGARVVLPVAMSASLLPGPTPPEIGMTTVADPTSTPGQIRTFLATVDEGTELSPPVSLVLPSLPVEEYGRTIAAAECVKRIVTFWESSRGSVGRGDRVRLDIEQPWTVERGRIARIAPSIEAAAWANAAHRLAGRRVAGTFPVSPGVTCLMLAPATPAAAARGGALVLWNDSCPPADAILQSPLGQGDIRIVDMFGNSRPATHVRTELGGEEVRVQATYEPVFIEGIDIDLTRFLAGLSLTPTLLESNNRLHEMELIIANPWATGITGTVRLLRPGGTDSSSRSRGWRVSPRTFNVSVGSGQTTRMPFGVSFSPAEEMGAKDFVMEVNIASDKPYKRFEVTRRVNIGLADLSLELATFFRGDGGKDLLIEATVTNTGQRNRTLSLTAYAPDMPRSKASISNLSPGTQTIRRFVYRNAAKDIAGRRVVVTVGDPGNDSQLTRSVLIEPH
jgi:hypothetical protein